MTGRGRDLLTPFEGMPVELANADFEMTVSPSREIMALDLQPPHRRMTELTGVRAGRASRAALRNALGDIEGTLLFQLLDDFPGASLVSDWVWSRWIPDWRERARRNVGVQRPVSTVDICTGFAKGASSLLANGEPDRDKASFATVPSLDRPDDTLGWHPLRSQNGPQMRRARRIDLWREGDSLKVDAGFQDSGNLPEGGRAAIHEYRIHAEIDATTGVLLTMQVQPLILPFHECPGASVKAMRMVGQRVAEFRAAVVERLPATLGCTHLNDMLRSLADVPRLAKSLPAK
jgi:hypothetical protein